jgi:hypothetical protein
MSKRGELLPQAHHADALVVGDQNAQRFHRAYL